MTCYNPKFAIIKNGFYWPKNNTEFKPIPTRILKFIPKSAVGTNLEIHGIKTISEDDPNLIAIPCRKCIGCLLDKASEWATRSYMEAKNWKNNCFLTLTYDNKHLPHNRSLRKKDIQNFLKKLRYFHTGIEDREYKGKIEKPIRYFYCGEYGPITKRPHYHMAIFNWKPNDLKFYSQNSSNDTLFTSKELNKIWGKGYIIIGNLTYESACYIARYTMKKIGKQFNDNIRKKVINAIDKARWERIEKLEEKFSQNMDTLDDAIIQKDINTYNEFVNQKLKAIEKNIKEPEFIEVSRKGGIGSIFWEKNKNKIKENMQILTQTKHGAKYKKIPEYIKNLWRKENPEEYIEKTEENGKKIREQINKIMKNTSMSKEQYRQMQLKAKIEQIKALKRLI